MELTTGIRDVCEGNGFPLHAIFLRDHTHFRQCLHFWSPIKITWNST